MHIQTSEFAERGQAKNDEMRNLHMQNHSTYPHASMDILFSQLEEDEKSGRKARRSAQHFHFPTTIADRASERASEDTEREK